MDAFNNASLGTHLDKSAVFKNIPHLPNGIRGIFVSHNAIIGTEVTIFHQVTIGEGNNGAPIIGNNCFIGANSIILPGVSIPNGSIVAAGSVVTKTITSSSNGIIESTTEGIIIGGNPAKFICKTADYLDKRNSSFLNLHGLSQIERKNVILQNKDKWTRK